MPNQKGQLILQVLDNLELPATVTEIVSHIAENAGVRPSEIKESVEETLNGGVRYGYLQRKNRRYFAGPVELNSEHSEEESEHDEESDDVEDRRRRRRRGRGRSERRRSRRRSRH